MLTLNWTPVRQQNSYFMWEDICHALCLPEYPPEYYNLKKVLIKNNQDTTNPYICINKKDLIKIIDSHGGGIEEQNENTITIKGHKKIIEKKEHKKQKLIKKQKIISESMNAPVAYRTRSKVNK